MKLDFFTLYLVIVLISLALAATWAAVCWQHRAFKPARFWLAGTLAMTLGGALLPLQHSTSLPVVAAALGNGLSIFGFWLFWIGTRQLYSGRGEAAVAIFTSVLSAWLVVEFWGEAEILALVYAIGQSIPMLLCLVFLLDRQRRSPGTAISSLGLLVALIGHGTVVAMNLWTMAGREEFIDFGVTASFTMLGLVFGGILWNFGLAVASMHHLRDEVAALVELAHLDPLTNAWNRRKFDALLEDEIDRSERGGEPFALLMLDLDHFKSVNDRMGHAGGDKGLRYLVKAARQHMRSGDEIARLGGDEFCILLPRTTALEAEAIGQKIVEAVGQHPVRHAGHTIQISCSVGVATWSEKATGTRAGALMAMADRALYTVKENGRNGVAFARETA